MKYVTAIMYGAEPLLEEIGVKLRQLGAAPALLEALARIETKPALSRDELIREMGREGGAILKRYKGHPILSELLEGFYLEEDDIETLGVYAIRLVQLGKRDFFDEVKN